MKILMLAAIGLFHHTEDLTSPIDMFNGNPQAREITILPALLFRQFAALWLLCGVVLFA